MKKKVLVLLSVTALTLPLAPVGNTQTPDEVPPANEGVCDSLQVDGVTKGLYGLCVAFCEAQDHASLDNPITPAEYELLADIVPTGTILSRYNSLMAETDPPMPCIKVEEPCPCWSVDELVSIDGILFDGVPAQRMACDERLSDPVDGVIQRILMNIFEYRDGPEIYSWAQTYERYNYGYCKYINGRNNPDGAFIRRQLFLQNGEVTREQLASCRNAIRAQIEMVRSSCTEGSHAP